MVAGVHVVRDVDRGGSFSIVRHHHSVAIAPITLDKAIISFLTVGKV